jgi:hypothetical protein
LTALTLDASATQTGLLVGLSAGVWGDRVRRRPILVGADIGRGLLLGTVPIAALTTGLSVGYLGVVAFLVSALFIGRFGVGRPIVWGAGIGDAAFLLAPLAAGPLAVAVPLLVASRLVATLAGPVSAINQRSLRP